MQVYDDEYHIVELAECFGVFVQGVADELD